MIGKLTTGELIEALGPELYRQVQERIAAFNRLSKPCEGCKRPMGFTPTGKPRKGSYCKACLNRLAIKKLPLEEQKRLSRERKAKYRQGRQGRKTKENG